jgi:hypothetical protein
MDSLAFISEMTKSLAWPLVSVCIAFIFRRQLQALLGRIKKGKVGPAEFEFEEGVKGPTGVGEISDKGRSASSSADDWGTQTCRRT